MLGTAGAVGAVVGLGTMAPGPARAASPSPVGTATDSPDGPAGPGTRYPPDQYPTVGPTTQVLDHPALLGDVVQPQWYEANIPFVDLPDAEIQATYYYRWRTYKEALKYTGPHDGWIVTEFLGPVGYSAPFGGINAAAGHHIYEGRWLRDHRYLDDYLTYWLAGTGAGAKPANDDKGVTSTDWAHQYSFWCVDAAARRAEVNGDLGFLAGLVPQLRAQYEQWKGNFDPDLGLYWQAPVWDAMEYSASSYRSSDPYHGGEGYRPTVNAYQFADARALAQLLHRLGDDRSAARYRDEALNLQRRMEALLWDPDRSFYYDVARDDNPGRRRLADREEIGFVPWYFGMAPAANSAAWAQLKDPQGFAAEFGPTTLERRSELFMYQAEQGCCRWDGPSWPFSTCQTLGGMANLLRDYPAQPYVDRNDYYAALRTYALTQRKDGVPYVAEAHRPDADSWIYDSENHSEDYNHSTFNDLVLSGLLGVRPQPDASVVLDPLVPASWDHFAVEGLAYHGHNLTVLWDRDGSRYGHGPGLSVWVDGALAHRAPTTARIRVAVAARAPLSLSRRVDDLANTGGAGYPVASASYTWRADSAADVIDGQDFALDIPSTRWTSYGSPNAADSLVVDLGAATSVSDVRIAFYDDGGGVRTPDSFALQYDVGGHWVDLPEQRRTPPQPSAREVNRVLLAAPVLAARLRVVPVRDDGGAVGITEMWSWRAPDPRLSATFVAPAENVLPVRGGRSLTVDTTVSVDRGVRPIDSRLTVPAGWSVSPRSSLGLVTAGRPQRLRWTVTPPAVVALGTEQPLRLLVTTTVPRGPVTSALTTARATFDPALFPRTLGDDTFDTDRLSRYRVDSPFGEPTPRFSVAAGTLRAATTGGRAGALLTAPLATVPSGTAVVVAPHAFAGSAPEDSLFLGFSGGDGDAVLAWYNNDRGQSGFNVFRGGRGVGSAEGSGSVPVRWAPGDRFAVVLQDGALTSWLEHQGTWRFLGSAPVGTAVDDPTLTTWGPAVGVRLDSGQIALDRATVLAVRS